MERTRRHVIRIAGSTLPLALAGCGEPGGDGGEEDGGEEGGGGEDDGAYSVDEERNDFGAARD